MAVSQARLVTVEEFLSLEEPEDGRGRELIDGVIEEKPVPKLKHSRAATRLARILDTHPATRDGEAFSELGKTYRTSRPNHRVPDVSYFVAGRVPSMSLDYPEESADLVVEVRSPGQSRRLLLERLRFLLANGARVALLVDPEEETVTVIEGEAEHTYFGDDDVRLAALEGFQFRADSLFR